MSSGRRTGLKTSHPSSAAKPAGWPGLKTSHPSSAAKQAGRPGLKTSTHAVPPNNPVGRVKLVTKRAANLNDKKKISNFQKNSNSKKISNIQKKFKFSK